MTDKDKKTLDALKMPSHAPPSYSAVMEARGQKQSVAAVALVADTSKQSTVADTPVAGSSHATATTAAQEKPQLVIIVSVPMLVMCLDTSNTMQNVWWAWKCWKNLAMLA